MKRTARFHHTLAFRLTLWYAGIFVVSSGCAFVLFYLLISRTIVYHMDGELADTAARFSTTLSLQGLSGIKRLAALEARAAGEKKVFFRLLYPNGEVFASSYMAYWERIPVSKGHLENLVSGRQDLYQTVQPKNGGGRIRVLYHWVGPGVVLQTGLAMDSYSGFFRAFGRVFVSAMGLVVLLSALPGWFMARKALGGVATVTRTAAVISGARLSERVPVTGRHDELDQLAATFNGMLDRIEHLVKSIREMGDNIAHDLKSPVTRIRGLAEVTLINAATQKDYEAMAASTIEEADRLLAMINTMLFISRTDSGEHAFHMAPLDLSVLADEACALFAPLAEDAGITLENRVRQPVEVTADREMMQRCLSNIIENAIKYTPSGGRVTLTTLLRHGEGKVYLRVADTGQGIAPAYLEQVFERFFRADPSRNRRGSGLGLSFARVVARAHGGDVTVESRQGEGSTFTIEMPLDPDGRNPVPG